MLLRLLPDPAHNSGAFVAATALWFSGTMLVVTLVVRLGFAEDLVRADLARIALAAIVGTLIGFSVATIERRKLLADA